MLGLPDAIWEMNILVKLSPSDLVTLCLVSTAARRLARATIPEASCRLRLRATNVSILENIRRVWPVMRFHLTVEGAVQLPLGAHDTDVLQGGQSAITKHLSSVHGLHLINTVHLTDAAPFSSVQQLTLDNCSAITDLTPLASIPCLTLCTSTATNLAPLATVKDLTLQDFSELSDLTPFRNAQKLTLVSCPRVTSIAAIQSVKALQLTGLTMLAEAAMRGEAGLVKISDCERLLRLKLTGTVTELQVERCGRLLELGDPMAGLDKASVRSCSQMHSILGLALARSVSLVDCDGVTDYAPLKNVHTVSLLGPLTHCDLAVLADVHTLSIQSGYVSDVRSLSRVHTLTLTMRRLQDVSPLVGVKRLTLASCLSLMDITPLSKVPSLTILNCPHVTGIQTAAIDAAFFNARAVLVSALGLRRESAKEPQKWRQWSSITPLHAAILEGALACAEYLLENGADVNAVASGRSGIDEFVNCTPLHIAAAGNMPREIEFLVKAGANVNAVASVAVGGIKDAKCQVISLAVFKGSLSAARALVRAGADTHAPVFGGAGGLRCVFDCLPESERAVWEDAEMQRLKAELTKLRALHAKMSDE